MRDDACQFAFIARGVDHAAVDVNESAGQREGVDVRLVDDAEAILKLRPARVRGEALTDAIQVRIRLRVVQDRELLLRLHCRLLADVDIVLRRKEIEARFDLRLRVSDAGAQHEHGDQGNGRPRDSCTLHGSSLLKIRRSYCTADAGEAVDYLRTARPRTRAETSERSRPSIMPSPFASQPQLAATELFCAVVMGRGPSASTLPSATMSVALTLPSPLQSPRMGTVSL